MISMEMIKLGPHDGVEQGDNHGEDGNCHKLEMLNLREKDKRTDRDLRRKIEIYEEKT